MKDIILIEYQFLLILAYVDLQISKQKGGTGMELQLVVMEILLDALQREKLITEDVCEKAKHALPQQKNLPDIFKHNEDLEMPT